MEKKTCNRVTKMILNDSVHAKTNFYSRVLTAKSSITIIAIVWFIYVTTIRLNKFARY